MEKYNTAKSVDSKKHGSQKRHKHGVFHKLKKTFSSHFNQSTNSTSGNTLPKNNQSDLPETSVLYTSRNYSVPNENASNGSINHISFQQRSMTLQPGATTFDVNDIWQRAEETKDPGLERFNYNTLTATETDPFRWQEGLAVYDMETLRSNQGIEMGALQNGRSTVNSGGHNFRPVTLEQVTWCDYCDDHIWGANGFKSCHRCSDCQMTCHYQCCERVCLPCEPSSYQVQPLSHQSDKTGSSRNNQLLIDAFYKQVSRSQNGGPLVVAMRSTNMIHNYPPPVTPCGSPYCIHSQLAPQPYHSYHQPQQAHPVWTQNFPSSGPKAAGINNNLDFTNYYDSASSFNSLRTDTLSSYTSSTLTSDLYSDTSLTSDMFSDATLSSASGTLVAAPSHNNNGSSSQQSRGATFPVETSDYVSQIDDDTLEVGGQKLSSAGNTPYATCRSNVSDCSTDYQTNFSFSLLLGGLICPSDTLSTTSDTLASSYYSSDDAFSTSSLSLRRLGYDFSTLDSGTIERYGIRVHEEEAPVSLAGEPASRTIVSPSAAAGGSTAAGGLEGGVMRGETSPWTGPELRRKVDIINSNEFGLIALLPDQESRKECQGTIRVHINLIRPIKMLLTPRPPSIYDIMAANDEVDEQTMAMTSFRLPRGSTKMLHIGMSTTAQEVISSLLKKFRIKDNPHKFSLYEHTIEGERDLCVRKIAGLDCPLRLLFVWAEDSVEEFNKKLSLKRLVLQENETGDIDWPAFSLPELNGFMTILTREEDEYRRQIQLKYSLIQEELMRLIQKHSSDQVTPSAPPPLPDLAALDILDGPLNERQSVA